MHAGSLAGPNSTSEALGSKAVTVSNQLSVFEETRSSRKRRISGRKAPRLKQKQVCPHGSSCLCLLRFGWLPVCPCERPNACPGRV